jgi:hypothetical protein
MHRPHTPRAFAALVSLSMVVTMAPSALAQRSPRVTVALVSQLADSAIATIIRTPGATGRTLVLLREHDADPVTLGSAMMALARVRNDLGDTVRTPLVVKVYGLRMPESIGPNERRMAEYYLARLRRAKQAPLDSLGLVKAIDVAVAPIAQQAATLR